MPNPTSADAATGRQEVGTADSSFDDKPEAKTYAASTGTTRAAVEHRLTGPAQKKCIGFHPLRQGKGANMKNGVEIFKGRINKPGGARRDLRRHPKSISVAQESQEQPYAALRSAFLVRLYYSTIQVEEMLPMGIRSDQIRSVRHLRLRPALVLPMDLAKATMKSISTLLSLLRLVIQQLPVVTVLLTVPTRLSALSHLESLRCSRSDIHRSGQCLCTRGCPLRNYFSKQGEGPHKR